MTAAKSYDAKRNSMVTPAGIKCQDDELGPEPTRASNPPQSPAGRFIKKTYSITQTWLHMNKSTRRSEDFDCLFPENNSNDLKKIKFVTYPYHLWGLGLLLVGGASFFCYALSSTSIYRFPKGFWWQYLFAVLLYFLGALCFVCSEIEVFCMDRNKGTIAISQRGCMHHVFGRGADTCVVRQLADIADVSVDCLGEKVGDVDTRMYKIRVEYTDGTHASILEDRSKSLAVRRCRSLKYFLAFYASSPTKKSQRSPPKAVAKPPDQVDSMVQSSLTM
ncbi:transmembrane protein [Achlya hypogyna]|uniref:Transmembrane protein n=1 Tax=Achlya hypogyna TaxID=1202772 RepID=A0A1V9YNL4_ACHHY|nr:transmembrane protein [Achlya hypogyna]